MKKIIALLAALACLFASALAEGAERVPAAYNFVLAEGEEAYHENLIFSGDVVIGGDNAVIMFANCEFNGDIILTADEATRVYILPDCEINGRYIMRNSVQEATMEYTMPKILSYVPAEVTAEDCIGAFISLGAFDVNYNGETYSVTESQLFFDNTNPDAGLVPYEGQEANCFVVCQWWENGEKVLLLECEYDSGI